MLLLSKRNNNCKAIIYTKEISKQLNLDLNKYNSQYKNKIEIKTLNSCHDRFLILDEKEIYHIWASLKDLGKKWFAFSKFENQSLELYEKKYKYENLNHYNFFMQKNSKIYIAWHRWLVWSAIVRQLENQGYSNLIYKTHNELNLLDQNQVKDFFEKEKHEYVFLAAAKVGWINANNIYPADFIYQNLQIQNNIIHNSYLHWVKKLLFLWSSCIYPKSCSQPIKEEYLLTGEFEKTNEPYAIAKIAWIKMCQSYNRQYGTSFIACMPTNLYWPNDNFDLENSHVLPAMIRKFHEGKVYNKSEVILRWDGSPYREFLYVDDMADACIYMMNNFDPSKEENEDWDVFMNIGTGIDIQIKDLAELIKKIIWFKWNIIWDTSKPNGTMKKLLDVSKIEKIGWKYKMELEKGVKMSYEWFLEDYK